MEHRARTECYTRIVAGIRPAAGISVLIGRSRDRRRGARGVEDSLG